MAEVTERSRWELAAESTVVKLRWFGIVMGYILVQTRTGLHDPWAVRAFLALGAGYAALDLAFWRMGEVDPQGLALARLAHGIRLHRAARATTIPGSIARSAGITCCRLICCSIRNRPVVAWWTLGFHSISLLGLAWVLGAPGRPAPDPAPDPHDHGMGDVGQLVAGRVATGGRRGTRAAQRRAGQDPRGAGASGRGTDDRACARRRPG